jgi:uncharacterized membrane protein YqiK
LSNRTYKEQAIWWLNAYWHKHENEADLAWSFVKKFVQLDLEKKAEGSGLDELNAHRFLESLGETLTVKELRETVRETGALGPNERPKLVPLIHYLLFRFRKTTDWHYLVNASQGDNKSEIEEAQRLLEQVIQAFEESRQKAEAAAHSLKEAQTREANAKKSEAEAQARHAESERAQEELRVALNELKAQEDEFNAKTNAFKSKSEDESVSVVNRNKAKNELAQHLASDPLPLRKAKISQEAAVKKAEKATAAAAEATKAAERAREAAEKARHEAAEAKAASDAAVDQAQRKVEEAQAFLDEVKRKPGQAQGSLWWIQKGIDEAKSFLPEKKGGLKRVDTTK